MTWKSTRSSCATVVLLDVSHSMIVSVGPYHTNTRAGLQLARDPALINFVEEFTKTNHGLAYYSSR